MAHFTAVGVTILIIAQCFSIEIYTNAIMAYEYSYRIGLNFCCYDTIEMFMADSQSQPTLRTSQSGAQLTLLAYVALAHGFSEGI